MRTRLPWSTAFSRSALRSKTTRHFMNKTEGRRVKKCLTNIVYAWVPLMLWTSSAAIAQEAAFPTRPVRMVIHIGPGSSMDIIGRVLGQKLNDLWGQPLIVDNRAGAGGTIGMDVVAKAPPDGYTILFGSGSMAIAPSFYRKLPFDTLRDFEPITQITSRYNVLVVPVSSQLN